MTPLLAFTLATIAGTLAGLRAGTITADLALPTTLSLCLCGAWLLAWNATPTRQRRVGALPALAGGMLLGAALGTGGAADARSHCIASIPDAGTVAVRGAFASLPWADGAAEFAVREIRARGRWQPCHGSIRVRVPPRLHAPPPGYAAELNGRWFDFPDAGRWPRPAERTGSLAASAVHATDGPAIRTLATRGRAQARIRTLLGDAAPIAEALALARREGLDPELKRDFAAAGLTHLLAISGTHVGMVAGALLLAFGTLRLPANTAAAAAAAGAVAYVLFLGAPHAAARAALQLLALLAVRLLQRPAEPFTLLAGAALILVIGDPLAPLDAGFQLSFAGIYGLLAWRRPILARLPRHLPRWVRDGIAAGTAATLATAPVAALHFGVIAPIVIPANLVAVPLVGIAVPALGIVLALDAVSTAAASFLATGTTLPLGLLRRTAAAAADVPFGHATVSSHTVLAALAAAACAIAAVRWLRVRTPGTGAPRQRVRSRRIAAAGTTAAVLLLAPTLSRQAGDALEIHAIDVGQGDALAIRTPTGRWILVDAGDRSDRFDAGRSRVVPFLLRQGVRDVDLLVLTHPHADHIGGATAVFDAFRVHAVVDPAVATRSDVYHATIRAGRLEGARWLAARGGRVLAIDDVTLEFLAPLDAVVDDPGDPNDFSVVFRLGFGRFAALFTGDAPAAVEQMIVDGEARDVTVLKVGHHGSATSTGEALLEALAPRVALVSAGRRNRYGHPDPGVLARLGRHGVRVLRTDEHGTITVRAHADGAFELRTAR